MSRALLVLIIVDFVTLVGKDVVMVLLLGHVRVRLYLSLMSFCVSFVILLSLGVLCLVALFLFGIVLVVLLVVLQLGGTAYWIC